MTSIVLQNASVIGHTEDENSSSVYVKEGMIAELPAEGNLVSDTVLDCSGISLFPGFIDVHNHGAVGFDVNTADVDGLLAIAAFLAKNGVTAWMPTLVPDSDENYRHSIDAIDGLMRRQADMPVAQAVGVHYEGIFASEKMCGALRPEYLRSGQWLVASGRLPRLESGVHMTTLAPEIDGGIELIEALVAEGWVVSIGHTRADVETLDLAFDAGARHLTHFFNAMTGIHHREIGVAGWGLYMGQVTFDIIADGVHVSPEMLGLVCNIKSPDKVSLISDSVAPTGLGDGEYELWGEIISVKNGRTQNERGTIAGSVSTMLDGVRMIRSCGFSNTNVAKMASANPARLLGIDDGRGSIDIGKRADLVGIDAGGNVVFTMIDGKLLQKPVREG